MKHILRAFSFGLLTATALLAGYYFFFETTENVTATSEPTEAEMIAQLETLGYYISETDPAINQDATGQPEPETEPEQDDEEPEVDTPEQAVVTNDQFVLTILPGTTISQVADYLMLAGLIKSRSEFTDYLDDNNYGHNIQIGQFDLDRSMSLDEVVDTIANQSN
ncbi:hypothetical protein SAMN04488134_101334 [Amphibacillus marinus]|uniref:YceG-like family protein n=1 Tax=Amphibacillus marinus TaxID=872970 RepID=A0A1H8HGP0_9BACI|nr:hypothetical protein [Amphibacillus marinus]SEN55067.1 hypothetical protein SAMN04488134_101334 [Amphibacillus marinus]